MPPSGFLISCARLRISSLLAWAWPSARSSRSCRVCCSISISSTSTRSGASIWLTITCTGSGSAWLPAGAAQLRRRSGWWRTRCAPPRRRFRAAAAGRRTSRTASRAACCGATAPSTFSKLALANRQRPSGATTATIVASRSKASKPLRRLGRLRGSRRLRVGAAGSLRQLGELALDARRCRFPCARCSAFISADAVEVLLVVALVALPLGLAVVVFLLQLGQRAPPRAAARPRGCGGRRCRARAARPGRRDLGSAAPPAADAARGLHRRAAWASCTTVIGAPSIVRQPLPWLPWP